MTTFFYLESISLYRPNIQIMKNFFFFAISFFISISLYGQDFPKGSTLKYSRLDTSSDTGIRLVIEENREVSKGPAAKNSSIWNKESALIGIQTRKIINNPKGLEAKNRKVWEDYEVIQVESKAAYELPKSMKRRKIWWH